MAIFLIDKIKQKNNGTFKLVDAQDIELKSGLDLETVLNSKAVKEYNINNKEELNKAPFTKPGIYRVIEDQSDDTFETILPYHVFTNLKLSKTQSEKLLTQICIKHDGFEIREQVIADENAEITTPFIEYHYTIDGKVGNYIPDAEYPQGSIVKANYNDDAQGTSKSLHAFLSKVNNNTVDPTTEEHYLGYNNEKSNNWLLISDLWENRISATELKEKLDGGSYISLELSENSDILKLVLDTNLASYDNSTSKFITNTVNDLTNYYKKSETYTQDEINQKISTIPKFAIEVVTALPTENISDTTVYLKKATETSENLYTEYIYVNKKWEILGAQTVDLKDYAKMSEVDTKLAAKQDKLSEDQLTNINDIPNKANASELTAINESIKTLQDTKVDSADYVAYSQLEKDKLAGIEDNANKFVLENASSTALGGIKANLESAESAATNREVFINEQGFLKAAPGKATTIKVYSEVQPEATFARTLQIGNDKYNFFNAENKTDLDGYNAEVKISPETGKLYFKASEGSYTLPVATTDILGGIKANQRDALTDTQEVKIDPTTNILYTAASSSGAEYNVNVKSTDELKNIKVNDKIYSNFISCDEWLNTVQEIPLSFGNIMKRNTQAGKITNFKFSADNKIYNKLEWHAESRMDSVQEGGSIVFKLVYAKVYIKYDETEIYNYLFQDDVVKTDTWSSATINQFIPLEKVDQPSSVILAFPQHKEVILNKDGIVQYPRTLLTNIYTGSERYIPFAMTKRIYDEKYFPYKEEVIGDTIIDQTKNTNIVPLICKADNTLGIELASESVLGGIKVGTSLSVDETGKLNVASVSTQEIDDILKLGNKE